MKFEENWNFFISAPKKLRLLNNLSTQSTQNSYDPCNKYSVVLKVNTYQRFEGKYYLHVSIPNMNVPYLSEKLGQQLQGYKQTKLKKTAICYNSITYP